MGTPNPGNVNFVPGSQDGGYEKYLPSLILRFEFMPDTLIGRATASKVLTRSPPSLALRRSTDIVGRTGSRGNPNLQPFQATQYDLGLDWYFADASFASATAFRKQITEFIRNSPPTTDTIDGIEYQITSPINDDSEVRIDGIELALQYAFDFLPAPFDGFGFIVNYTYQESQGFLAENALTGPSNPSPYPFPGLSESSYNLSGYYENDWLSARLSYNWRDQ